MKKKKRIALALAAALMMVLLLAACSDKTIRLGVAGTGGVYQVFGEDYAALQAQNGGLRISWIMLSTPRPKSSSLPDLTNPL